MVGDGDGPYFFWVFGFAGLKKGVYLKNAPPRGEKKGLLCRQFQKPMEQARRGRLRIRSYKWHIA